MKTTRILSFLALAMLPIGAWGQQTSTGAGTSAAAGGTAVTVNPDGTRVLQPAPTVTSDAQGAVISTGSDGGGATVSPGTAGNAGSTTTAATGQNPDVSPMPSATPGATATPEPLNSGSDNAAIGTRNSAETSDSNATGNTSTDANGSNQSSNTGNNSDSSGNSSGSGAGSSGASGSGGM